MVKPTTGCQANGTLPLADPHATPYRSPTSRATATVPAPAAPSEMAHRPRTSDQLATGKIRRSSPTMTPNGAPIIKPHPRAPPTCQWVGAGAAAPRLAARSTRLPVPATTTQTPVVMAAQIPLFASVNISTSLGAGGRARDEG